MNLPSEVHCFSLYPDRRFTIPVLAFVIGSQCRIILCTCFRRLSICLHLRYFCQVFLFSFFASTRLEQNQASPDFNNLHQANAAVPYIRQQRRGISELPAASSYGLGQVSLHLLRWFRQLIRPGLAFARSVSRNSYL